jgi:hypothetical protein
MQRAYLVADASERAFLQTLGTLGAALLIAPIAIMATVPMSSTLWWLMLEWLVLSNTTVLILNKQLIRDMLRGIAMRILAKVRDKIPPVDVSSWLANVEWKYQYQKPPKTKKQRR